MVLRAPSGRARACPPLALRPPALSPEGGRGNLGPLSCSPRGGRLGLTVLDKSRDFVCASSWTQPLLVENTRCFEGEEQSGNSMLRWFRPEGCPSFLSSFRDPSPGVLVVRGLLNKRHFPTVHLAVQTLSGNRLPGECSLSRRTCVWSSAVAGGIGAVPGPPGLGLDPRSRPAGQGSGRASGWIPGPAQRVRDPALLQLQLSLIPGPGAPCAPARPKRTPR